MKTISKTICTGLVLVGMFPAIALCASDAARELAVKINDANNRLRSGDLDAAITAYQQAGTDSANNTELSYNLAVAQYRKGDVSTAERLFQTAAVAENDAIAAKARYNLGNCNFAAALRDAEKDHAAAIIHLESAIGNYRSALDVDPADADARANIERAVALIDKLQQQEKKEQQQQKDQQAQQESDKLDKSQNSKNEQSNSDQDQTQQQDQNKQQQSQDQQQQNQQSQDSQSSSTDASKENTPDQKEQRQSGSESKHSTKDQSKEFNQNGDDQKNQQLASQSPERDQPQQTESDSKPTGDPKQQQQQDQRSQNFQSQSHPNQQQRPGNDKQDQPASSRPEPSSDTQGTVSPKGALTAGNESPNDDKRDETLQALDAAQDGEMTQQEAEKLLQAIRDREMLRRLRRQAAERERHVPVERDW